MGVEASISSRSSISGGGKGGGEECFSRSEYLYDKCKGTMKTKTKGKGKGKGKGTGKQEHKSKGKGKV